MFTLEIDLAAALTAILAFVGMWLLLDRGAGWGAGWIGRWFAPRRAGARSPGLGWPPFAAVVAVGYAAVVAFDVSTGRYNCPTPSGVSDLLGLRASGAALLRGGDPFRVPDCGGTTVVPYGLAAVAIDALGSLGGDVGIAVVWGVVALALVPCVWYLGGRDRWYPTLLLVASPIYFPVIAGQIDGAANALVPLTVLGAVLVARRWPVGGGATGGLLATARFPALFPVVAATGASTRRPWAAAGALGAFGLVTAASALRWGAAFADTVFLSQATRRSFSLNAFGILLNAHALPGGIGLAVAQAISTVVVMVAAALFVRSPLRAAALSLTGIALLTQFLSYGALLWLVPVVLLGDRERWWLWAVSLVGSLNYLLAFHVAGAARVVPTDVLDAVLTVLLLGLFLELWSRRTDAALAAPPPSAG